MQPTAIAIDTQTVMSNSYDFDGGLLGQLKQFRGSAIQMVLSDVTVREIQRHLRAATRKAKDSVESAHRDAVRFGFLGPSKSSTADADSAEVADARLNQFLEETGAIIVPTTAVGLEDVLQRYFATSAPFSTEKGKQKEFPDAIALMSLEEWAATNCRKILAVSADSDWKRYAQSSDWLEHADDLADALQSFQKDLSSAVAQVERFFEGIRIPGHPLSDQLETSLVVEMIYGTFEAEAQSAYAHRAESLSVSYNSFEILPQTLFRIVGIAPKEISIEIPLVIEGNAQATFQLFQFDNAKAEFVDCGVAVVDRAVRFKADFVIQFNDDVDEITIAATMIGTPTINLGNMMKTCRPEVRHPTSSMRPAPTVLDRRRAYSALPRANSRAGKGFGPPSSGPAGSEH